MYSGYNGRELPPTLLPNPWKSWGWGGGGEILTVKRNTFYPTAST